MERATAAELTRYGTIEKIDMVEIDKMVVDACSVHAADILEALRRGSPYTTRTGLNLSATRSAYDLIVDSTDLVGRGSILRSTEIATRR